MIEGIDISSHQSRTPIIGTLGFVFARGTYGLTPDDMFATHKANVHGTGAILGAYHFGRDMDGAAQARAFLNVIGATQLVALDFEKDGQHGHMTPDQARTFIRAVQATGRKVGLYASASGYPSLGQDWRWIAKWSSTPPPMPWAFWQWASGSEHPSHLDRDRFSGTETQLRILAGAAHWHWVRKPQPGQTEAPFYIFDVAHGVITGRHLEHTSSTDQPCTRPNTYPWPKHVAKPLVQLLAGPRKGEWVHARWARHE